MEVGDIPEWMLLEVLMRLPFKVLFKFKIVSKQWRSMISGTSFARMYADRMSRFPRSQHWILVSSFANKAMTQHFLRKKQLTMDANCMDLLALKEDQEVLGLDHIVVGTSNGLLLYGPRAEAATRTLRGHEICNPITGQRITVPPSQHHFEFVATGFVTQVQDNVLQSYRVVRVDVHHMNSGFVRFHVYISETLKWEYFTITSSIYFYKWKNPVVLGQTLHWMITKHRVIAYDPYNEPDSIRIIRLPSDDAASYEQSKIETELDNVLFDQHQGLLRYVQVKLDGLPTQLWTNLSIWVLNNYDSGSWCLQHIVSLDEMTISSVPLSFHPFDPNILYIINNEALFSYDFKARELKTADGPRNVYHQLPYRLSYFSFVIPPWPVFIHPSVFEVTD